MGKDDDKIEVVLGKATMDRIGEHAIGFYKQSGDEKDRVMLDKDVYERIERIKEPEETVADFIKRIVW